MRIESCISDLHAADAKYHNDCITKFSAERNISSARSSAKIEERKQHGILALKHVIHILENETTKVWDSVEVHQLYCDKYDELASSVSTGERQDKRDRSNLLKELKSHFGEELVLLSRIGCSTLLCFQDHLVDILRGKANQNETDLKKLCEKISHEIQLKDSGSRDSYKLSELSEEEIITNCSDILLTIVSNIVSNGSRSKKAIFLTQAIQAAATNSYNCISLSLGIKLFHLTGSREVIDQLNSCGFVCSYDEIRRFRKSAAVHTSENEYSIKEFVEDGDGLVATWIDNFDLNIFSPNGMKQTHVMAVEILQNGGMCTWLCSFI